MSFELISEQERQSTCDVTLRHTRATIVAVEKQEVFNILCVCVCQLLPIHSVKCPCAILPSVVYPAVLHFCTLEVVNCTIFVKK